MIIDFAKFPDRLVPAIVQDWRTGKVLMLGYVNEESLRITEATGNVTFFSRSRQTLWTKGETSGNFLRVKQILPDCDADAILIKAEPVGAVCHTGNDTCFNEKNESDSFLSELEETIWQRKTADAASSYTAKLFAKGAKKIAQKVGEEAVELVIEAQHGDDELFRGETADLLYHLLVLLASRNVKLADVAEILRQRKK